MNQIENILINFNQYKSIYKSIILYHIILNLFYILFQLIKFNII